MCWRQTDASVETSKASPHFTHRNVTLEGTDELTRRLKFEASAKDNPKALAGVGGGPGESKGDGKSS